MLLKTLSVNLKIDLIVSSMLIIESPSELVSARSDISPFIVLKYPTLKDRLLSDCIYKKAVNKAKSDGFMSSNALEKTLLKRGVFREEEYVKEEFLVKQVEAQKILLDRMRVSKDKIALLKAKIEKLESELVDIRTKRTSYLINTYESVASQEKLDYLVWASLFDLADKRVWDTFDDYMNETDMEVKNILYAKSIEFLYGFDIKDLRYIARHPEWRVRYTSFLKGNFPLYPCSPDNYTKDQLGLMHWSNYYQSIYDMLPEDRPDDAIIEDDAKLDKYMEEYFKELEQSRKISHARNKGADAFDREEVIVTRFNELYEDLDYDKVPKANNECKILHVGKVKG